MLSTTPNNSNNLLDIIQIYAIGITKLVHANYSLMVYVKRDRKIKCIDGIKRILYQVVSTLRYGTKVKLLDHASRNERISMFIIRKHQLTGKHS